MSEITETVKQPVPPCRRLRVFAFDPLFSRQLDTHGINEVILKLPWDESLAPGPVDDYVEVVDYDPASQAFYAPVDLTDAHLVAQDGHSPSETSPQFHQQMVFGVARTTIGHFERALGRRPLWSKRLVKDGKYTSERVDRLRIYPHAFRGPNAYYSPDRKALLFGYFPASTNTPGMNMPGETVFTCLSYDVIAHETTHALIDGLHPRFGEPSNRDVLALHEAIADIIALFQHFTHPEILKHQIARTRGDLSQQNLLAELAFQIGQAVGNRGALREAIGSFNDNDEWVPKKPDRRYILTVSEPHGRGAVLVAAIFDAYIMIYSSRVSDLLRIASAGTGILPEGKISPDLVNRLADEAAKIAEHMLQICIRALDYCPPVDCNFGDYLRALITADRDLVPDDPHHYRLAVIEAFRRRGIYPADVRNLSEESLVWHVPSDDEQRVFKKIFSGLCNPKNLIPTWDLHTDPGRINREIDSRAVALHRQIVRQDETELYLATKLTLDRNVASLYTSDDGAPAIEIHSVRPARRIGPDGQTEVELVVEITQRRRGYFDPEIQQKVDHGESIPLPEPGFIFRGGCTLIVDPAGGRVRYCIYKNIRSDSRLARMRDFLEKSGDSFAGISLSYRSYRDFFRHEISEHPGLASGFEPFALLHGAPQLRGDR